MRSITPRGWVALAVLTVALFWWWTAAHDEADVPSYREHRQGAILRDSDIEHAPACYDHPPLRCIHADDAWP